MLLCHALSACYAYIALDMMIVLGVLSVALSYAVAMQYFSAFLLTETETFVNMLDQGRYSDLDEEEDRCTCC